MLCHPSSRILQSVSLSGVSQAPLRLRSLSGPTFHSERPTSPRGVERLDYSGWGSKGALSMTLIVPVLRTWMRAVSEISRAVNVAAPLDVVLTKVADQARDLIGFDFCAVMLADDNVERLEIVGWSGLNDDYVKLLRDDSSLQIEPGSPDADSPAARAFREVVTVTVSDTDRDAAAYGRLRLASLQGYKSLVASPLHGEDEPIGVLVGYSKAPRMYGKADIELSELLAEQTAIAIHTSKLRSRREWAEQQHSTLMKLVLDGVGLDGLASALSEVLDTAVAVIDTEGRRLDGKHTDPNSDWTDDLYLYHHVDEKREAGYATQFVERANGDACVTPVIIGGKVAAQLWVLGEKAMSDTTTRRLVEQFALVVGMELLAARHALEVEARLSGDLIYEVLRRESVTEAKGLIERSRVLGFDLEDTRNVVLISANKVIDRLPAVVRQVRDAVRTNVLAAAYEDDIVFLMPEVPDLRRALDRVLRQRAEHDSATKLTVVVSPPIERADDIRSAYQASFGAARLRAGAEDSTGLVDLRHLSVLDLLLMADAPSVYLKRLADQLIAPIALQDQQRDAQLVMTLRAWLDSGFSSTKTAKELTVHVNTVGQRLARIEKLSSKDLRLPSSRLDLQLALHVWDVLQLDRSESLPQSRTRRNL
ncbi:MAG: hypothetical protein C0482_28895 [Gordonia sp.]|nr:hypothetical protein [Gordonia sp. (in: high G+C Gram-positive bacteria)]